MGGLIDMKQKYCEFFIHDHASDLCVIMVVWVDVPDNKRGDFRCERAIDTTSLQNLYPI